MTYPKLVRDNIPDIIKANEGKEPHTDILHDDELYLKALLNKLLEEAKEANQSTTDEHLQEELADILEVIHAIMRLKNWNPDTIADIQLKKRTSRGGFDKRILLLQKP